MSNKYPGVFKRPGSEYYWIDFFDQFGKRQRMSTKQKSARTAARMRADKIAEVNRGTFVPPNQSQKTTLSALRDVLVKTYQQEGRRSGKRATGAFRNLLDHFGDIPVNKIDKASLVRYRDSRIDQGRALSTANYELAVLKRAFKLAKEAGLIGLQPDFPNMSPPQNARTGFFTESELSLLLLELPEHVRGIAEFAYLTGWRKREITGLTWDRVDFGNGTVELRTVDSKNKRGRIFPMDALPRLRSLLERQREEVSRWEERYGKPIPWVFHLRGNRVGEFYKSWRSACRRAGLGGRLLHDFRRTAVRNLERAGVPRSTAMQLTGHKTEAVYTRYDIVDESDLRDGVAKLAGYLRHNIATVDKESRQNERENAKEPTR